MHLNDPATYMRMRGYPPNILIECAVCPTRFEAKNGIAFPARNKDGQTVMAAFCGPECYLRAMPAQQCFHA
jgi:hypothetical protein